MLHILRYLICFSVASAAFAQTSKPVFDPMNAPVPAAAKPVAAVPAKAAPIPTPVPAKTVVAAPVRTPATAAAAPVVAAVAPVAALPVKPVGPMVVPFDQLEAHVGKMVSIKTNLRTTRKGVLKRFNRAGIVIEDTSRGFAMSIDIPRSTVVEVTVQN